MNKKILIASGMIVVTLFAVFTVLLVMKIIGEDTYFKLFLLSLPLGVLLLVLNRLKELNLGKNSVLLERIDDVKEHIKHLGAATIERTSHYNDYKEAHKDIKKLLTNKIQPDGSETTFHFQFLSLSMNYSWQLISETLVEIARNNPNVYFHIEAILVDPEYIESLNISKSNLDWAKKSKQTKLDIEKFIEDEVTQSDPRFKITVNFYRNLPHWHGILIDGTFLFLGRTNWVFGEELPQLTVGENKYRYFHGSWLEGRERIDLYKNWFRYYSSEARNVPEIQKDV